MAGAFAIHEFLREARVPYRVVPHRPGFTAQEQATAAHVPARDWAKVVVCFVDGVPAQAVLPAPLTVNLARLMVLARGRRDQARQRGRADEALSRMRAERVAAVRAAVRTVGLCRRDTGVGVRNHLQRGDADRGDLHALAGVCRDRQTDRRPVRRAGLRPCGSVQAVVPRVGASVGAPPACRVACRG